jgi:agmatine deiminase
MKILQLVSALAAFVAGAGVVSSMSASPAPEVFTFPAEFEPQSAVWIGARPEENGRPTLGVIVQMVQALAPHVDIYLMVSSLAAQAKLQNLLGKARVDLRRVHFQTITSSPTQWYRDIGPIFLKGSHGHLKVVDFDFNCYGDCRTGSAEARQKEGIDRQIASAVHLPVVRTEIVSEGGDREVNGRGTLMAVEATEMQRNPHLTRDQIERELLHVLGQKKMIWLKRGVAEDDDAERGPVYANIYAAGAGGHVDEMARFTGPDTVLLAEVTPLERDSDPVLRISYERLQKNYRILQSATDQDGHRLRIVRMPVADPIYLDLTPKPLDPDLSFFRGSKPGQPLRIILPASYMNFVVSNGIVLVPKYWRPGRPETIRRKDEAARRILQNLFPDREIVQIDAENLNHGGGGMHCATQQQPVVSTRV